MNKRAYRIAREQRKNISDSHIQPVYQICIHSNHIIKLWASQKEAAMMLKCSSSGISACANGRIDTHVGYKWQHAHLRPLEYIMKKGF